MSGDHPNDSITEDGRNTVKSPGDLRRIAVTQTPVKNHQLTLIRKTLKKYIIIIRRRMRRKIQAALIWGQRLNSFSHNKRIQKTGRKEYKCTLDQIVKMIHLVRCTRDQNLSMLSGGMFRHQNISLKIRCIKT